MFDDRKTGDGRLAGKGNLESKNHSHNENKPFYKLIEHISTYQNMSEEFIENHVNNLNLNSIFRYQKLAENFIEKHAKQSNYNTIVLGQNLSGNFIEKHFHLFDIKFLGKICKNYVGDKIFSQKFIENNCNLFSVEYLLKNHIKFAFQVYEHFDLNEYMNQDDYEKINLCIKSSDYNFNNFEKYADLFYIFQNCKPMSKKFSDWLFGLVNELKSLEMKYHYKDILIASLDF